MQIIFKVSQLDYNSIASQVLPALLEKININKDKENKKWVDILLRFRDLPGKSASAALMFLPQNVKDELAVYLLRSFDSKAVDSVNKFMKDKEMPLTVYQMNVEKKEQIEISLVLADISYEELFIAAYPKMKDKLSGNEKYGKLFGVLQKIDDPAKGLVNAALGALSQEDKDNLVIDMVSVYEEELVSVINKLADEYGLKLTISGIEIKK